MGHYWGTKLNSVPLILRPSLINFDILAQYQHIKPSLSLWMVWIFWNFPCPFLGLTTYRSKSLHLATVELCMLSSQKADRESRAGILEQSVRTRDPAGIGFSYRPAKLNRLAGRYYISIPARSIASQIVLKFQQRYVLKHSPTVHRTKYRQSQSS